MYLISRGLLLAAIKHGNREAGRAFTLNFSHLDLREEFGGNAAQDIEYCERIFRENPIEAIQ
jgi:hypothetical protein